jgi:hypothetical protein
MRYQLTRIVIAIKRGDRPRKLNAAQEINGVGDHLFLVIIWDAMCGFLGDFLYLLLNPVRVMTANCAISPEYSVDFIEINGPRPLFFRLMLLRGHQLSNIFRR